MATAAGSFPRSERGGTFPRTPNAWRWVLGAVVLVVACLLARTAFYNSARIDLDLVLESSLRLFAAEPIYRDGPTSPYTKSALMSFLFAPLSWLSRPVVHVLWDSLNLSLFMLLTVAMANRWREDAVADGLRWPRALPAHAVAILAFATLSLSFNAELRKGQYNYIALALVWWSVFGGSRFASGPAFALAVVLKATNILYLPLLLRVRPRGSPLVGMALTLLALSAAFIFTFGYGALIDQHLQWVEFMPIAVGKYIDSATNFGLPAFMAPLVPSPSAHLYLLGVGAVVAALVSFGIRNRVEGFAAVGIVHVVISPMTWHQNFCLLTPLLISLWGRFFCEATPAQQRKIILVGLVSLFLGISILGQVTTSTRDPFWVC